MIQTCFKFQILWTDLIPGFNTSKFLIKPAIIQKVSFRLSSSFPPYWKLSLHCFNMFIAFNSFVHTLLGIAFLCCKVFEIVKVGSSMYPVSRAFFPVCFLSCTRHSPHLAYLHSRVLRAYCNYESTQVISITLFGRRANNNECSFSFTILNVFENKKGIIKILIYSSVIDINQMELKWFLQ